MRDVYKKPVSLEMDREERVHYRILSVSPDGASNLFIAKYELLDDERNTFFQFELRVPADVEAVASYWQPLFEQVGTLYERKEDVLAYGYRIKQAIIEAIFKQTKKEAPKKTPAAKLKKEETESVAAESGEG
ncbi:MAG: hypothetical protein HRF49_02800 [bacterium]|jgi:hypothetical protein